MVILDLVIIDEFNEPYEYASMPVKITLKSLFDNKLNLDLGMGQSRFDEDTTQVFSLEYAP